MKIKQFIPKKESTKKYLPLWKQNLFTKLFYFLKFFVQDLHRQIKDKSFNEYALTIFAGRQGSGKTMSLVAELERIRHDFPDVTICTNFGYIHEDIALTDWQQILDLRNPSGIVFALDEIQNEFDIYNARSFDTNILRVVTQQRKQKIKMYATSQVFKRVSKPLREQTYEVVECVTLFGRWTFQKCFDADDYNAVIDSENPDKKMQVRRKYRRNFVQNDYIRNLYNSYAVIENMSKLQKDATEKAEKIMKGAFGR